MAYYRRSPEEMGWEEVRGFLLHLRDEKHLSPSTQKVCAAALKFLYTVTLDRPEAVKSFCLPKVPPKHPEVLSGSEVEALLGAIRSITYRAVIMTTYGAGLRIAQFNGQSCRVFDAAAELAPDLFRQRSPTAKVDTNPRGPGLLA